MSYSDRYSSRYSEQHFRRLDRSTSPFVMLGKIAFICLLIVGAAMGGLWLLGAVIGLSLGILGLLLVLSPIIFVLWIVWLVFKALIF